MSIRDVSTKYQRLDIPTIKIHKTYREDCLISNTFQLLNMMKMFTKSIHWKMKKLSSISYHSSSNLLQVFNMFDNRKVFENRKLLLQHIWCEKGLKIINWKF